MMNFVEIFISEQISSKLFSTIYHQRCFPKIISGGYHVSKKLKPKKEYRFYKYWGKITELIKVLFKIKITKKLIMIRKIVCSVILLTNGNLVGGNYANNSIKFYFLLVNISF